MVRTSSLIFVVLAALLLDNVGATLAKARTKRMRAGAKWWFWTETPVEKPKLRPPPKRLADTKKVLLATAVFQKKAASECLTANMDEKQACEHAASERLFCAMFARHAERFQGMSGVEEQKKACFETNIMETSLDVAKDEQEQAAARDA